MTKDDLQQIDQLIQNRFDLNNKKLKQEIKIDIKAEVEPIHERFDAQRDQITHLEQKITDVETHLEQKITNVEKNLSAKINLEVTDLAEIIRDAIFPKLDLHDEQIAQLQEETGLKPTKH